jgi:hypothetical protein
VAFNRRSNSAAGSLSAEQFIQGSLGGFSVQAHAALLGLQYSGSKLLPDNQKALRMEWAPAAAAAAAAVNAQHQAGASSSSSGLRATAVHSAASLFLDLKMPFKHFVEAYAADPVLPTSRSFESATDWCFHGSPLTLVHLLALAVPHETVALLQALLRTAGRGGLQGPAALFKHELTMHGGRTGEAAAAVQHSACSSALMLS